MSGDKRAETGILDAMRRAIADTEELGSKQERKPAVSVFMNPKRQAVFSFLCSRPCSPLSSVASGTGMSTTTARWHLRLLGERGFVSVAPFGKRVVYYPTGLVPPEHVAPLASLSDDVTRGLMRAVVQMPGSSQRELCSLLGLKHQACSPHLDRLVQLGMVSGMKDGRFSRYYPSDSFAAMRQAGMRHINMFRKTLIAMLRKDGVSPRIARTTYGELHIEVARGRERRVIPLQTDPLVTALS